MPMGRKQIPNLDEKLLEATIDVGGSNSPNINFSTKRIASLCGTSEFTLFQRYENKTVLITKAMQKCEKTISDKFKELSLDQNNDFPAFIDKAFHYFLSEPKMTLFMCNYFPAASRSKNTDEDFALYCENGKVFFDSISRYFKKLDDDTMFLVWSSLLRHLLFDAQFILANIMSLDKDYENRVIEVNYDGLYGFLEDF
jgi:AcrR family transcriptional regulator